MSISIDSPAKIEKLNYYDQYISSTPIEYRITLARDNIARGKLYYIKDYNLWIIRKHSRTGKFIKPTKKEFYQYQERMEEILYWL